MYSPPYNQVEDRAELLAFMRASSFATLVTGTGGKLMASHLPFQVFLKDDAFHLDCHMAKNNPQWQEFFDDEEVMVVFAGPHAYVSPRWYEETERVPTWNYTAVHAYGIPRVLNSREEMHRNQRRLVERLDPQWLPRFDALGPKYVDRMLEGIVSFEIPVARLETRFKLSQNRSRREQELIIEQLEKSPDSSERALAEISRRHLPPKG